MYHITFFLYFSKVYQVSKLLSKLNELTLYPKFVFAKRVIVQRNVIFEFGVESSINKPN